MNFNKNSITKQTTGDKMQRITVKDLEKKIKELNLWTESDLYILGGAYGGYRLEKQVKQGGIIDVLRIGYVPKRELYDHLFTLIEGIMIGNGWQQTK